MPRSYWRALSSVSESEMQRHLNKPRAADGVLAESFHITSVYGLEESSGVRDETARYEAVIRSGRCTVREVQN